MTNWKKTWESYPKTVGETDFLNQVEKTVGGQPISNRQFQLIVSGVYRHLGLKETDMVLDLCCGNGLITKEIAKKCKKNVGVDFSLPLLEVANRYHRPENVSYRHMSVLDFDKISIATSSCFNKVLMYEALQHFKKRDLIRILRNILSLTDEGGIILLGNIPDSRKKWKFYNTHQRQRVYLLRKIIGRDAIGTWWGENFIRETCKQLALLCVSYIKRKGLVSRCLAYCPTLHN